MDYIVTFEDGSSAYLAHYGVKGMKWDESKKRGLTPQAGGQTSRSTTKTSKERASKTANRIKSFASGLKGSSSSAGGKTGKDNKKAANALNDKSKDKGKSKKESIQYVYVKDNAKGAKRAVNSSGYSKGYLRKYGYAQSLYDSIKSRKRAARESGRVYIHH